MNLQQFFFYNRNEWGVQNTSSQIRVTPDFTSDIKKYAGNILAASRAEGIHFQYKMCMLGGLPVYLKATTGGVDASGRPNLMIHGITVSLNEKSSFVNYLETIIHFNRFQEEIPEGSSRLSEIPVTIKRYREATPLQPECPIDRIAEIIKTFLDHFENGTLLFVINTDFSIQEFSEYILDDVLTRLFHRIPERLNNRLSFSVPYFTGDTSRISFIQAGDVPQQYSGSYVVISGGMITQEKFCDKTPQRLSDESSEPQIAFKDEDWNTKKAVVQNAQPKNVRYSPSEVPQFRGEINALRKNFLVFFLLSLASVFLQFGIWGQCGAIVFYILLSYIIGHKIDRSWWWDSFFDSVPLSIVFSSIALLLVDFTEALEKNVFCMVGGICIALCFLIFFMIKKE